MKQSRKDNEIYFKDAKHFRPNIYLAHNVGKWRLHHEWRSYICFIRTMKDISKSGLGV